MEVEMPARKRIGVRKDDLRTRSRCVGNLPTIRMEDIERLHRKEKYLR
jgi:hypothetical protein